jgi:hypothetical protein
VVDIVVDCGGYVYAFFGRFSVFYGLNIFVQEP